MRQPAYRDVALAVVGGFANADAILNDVLWVGTFSGRGAPEIDYIARTIRDLLAAPTVDSLQTELAAAGPR